MYDPYNIQLGQAAINQRWISQEQAQYCLQQASQGGTPFLQVAVQAGYLSEQQCQSLLAQYGPPPVQGAGTSGGMPAINLGAGTSGGMPAVNLPGAGTSGGMAAINLPVNQADKTPTTMLGRDEEDGKVTAELDLTNMSIPRPGSLLGAALPPAAPVDNSPKFSDTDLASLEEAKTTKPFDPKQIQAALSGEIAPPTPVPNPSPITPPTGTPNLAPTVFVPPPGDAPALESAQQAQFEEAKVTRPFNPALIQQDGGEDRQKSLEKAQKSKEQLNRLDNAYRAIPATLSDTIADSATTPNPSAVLDKARQSNEMINRLDHAYRAIPAAPQAPPSSYPKAPMPSTVPGSGSGSGPGSLGTEIGQVVFDAERYKFSGDPNVEGPNPVLDSRIQRRVTLLLSKSLAPDVFYRPARILAQLDHPSIPKVHDIGTYQGALYYTVDRLQGRRLEDRIRDPKHVRRIDSSLRTFLAISSAMVHAHGRGIVHTDINPHVIVLGDYGEIWISGWHKAVSLSHASKDVLEACSSPVPDGEGKKDWPRAPELIENGEASNTTDVWGLGAFLHVMLCKNAPRVSRIGIKDDLDEVRLFGQSLPRELIAITKKAIALNPSERYSDVASFQEDIRRYLDGEGVEAAADSGLQSFIRSFKKNPKLSTAISVIAVVLLLLGLLTANKSFSQYQHIAELDNETQKTQDAVNELEKMLEKKQSSKVQFSDLSNRRREFKKTLEKALFASAQAKPDDLEVDRRVLAIFNKALDYVQARPTEAPNTLIKLRQQFYRTRANWHLRQAQKTDPVAALEDYKKLSSLLTASDQTEALLGRFLASHRAGLDDEESSALRELEQLKSPEDKSFSLFAQYQKKIATLEQESFALPNPRSKKYKKKQKAIRQKAEKYLVEIKRIANSGYPYPVASYYALRGRCHSIHSGRGYYKNCASDNWKQSILDFATAYSIDPSDPNPLAQLLILWNEKWGRHASWRWVNGYLYGRLLESIHTLFRPGPLLTSAKLLESLQHSSGAGVFVDRIFQNDVITSNLSRASLSTAQIMRGRSAFARRKKTLLPNTPKEVVSLEASSWAFLKAKEAIKAGNLDDALARFQFGKKALSFNRGAQAYYDLADFLSQPEAAREIIYNRTQDLVPAATPGVQDGPQVKFILAGRIALASRIKKSIDKDIYRFNRGFSLKRLPPKFRETIDHIAWHGYCRSQLQSDPKNPATHHFLMRSWASMNMYQHTERFAYEAQQLIVERLKAGQRPKLAEQFSSFEAVKELWPRRYWVPREIYSWGQKDGEAP